MDRYPAYIVPLPKDLAQSVRCADLLLMNCLDCGHLQQAVPDPEIQRLIYDVYYSYYSVDRAEALLPHYRVPFHTFFSETFGRLSPALSSLLEIGCSSGANVDFFKQFCERYVGVDASEKIADAKREHPDCEFVHGYFPGAMPSGRFDCIVSQFNLEHIADLVEFLTAAWQLASERATLVIQVPDIGEFVRHGQPNFLAHEHLQYFRQDQLAYVMRRTGWEPETWAPQGSSLICAAKRSQPITQKPQMMKNDDVEGIAHRLAQTPAVRSNAVVMYGVGPQLFWLAQRVAPEAIKYVVDDNPSYKGHHVPALGLPVLTLTEEMLAEVPYVVLSLNSIYHEKVIARIRSLGRTTTILACLDNGWAEFTVN
ncbi:class I SAM-dependent methyltransferase [Dongia sp.]|uniref:class I SAM-dependent methyltransferase n=1 Tax=Dongia sp. TaxID=1977262 RepID=UPI0035B049B7